MVVGPLAIKIDRNGDVKKFKACWVCRGLQDAQKWGPGNGTPTLKTAGRKNGVVTASVRLNAETLEGQGLLQGYTRYGFPVACQHAASCLRDLLHIDLKTALVQGVFTTSSAAISDRHRFATVPCWSARAFCVWLELRAPRRWRNRIDKFLRSSSWPAHVCTVYATKVA